MGTAIGAVLPLGIGVALSPVPIIAVVLMLAAPSGRTNGPAFIAGWVVGLATVGVLVLLLSAGAGGAGQEDSPATWVSVVKLLLGLALIVLAGLRWHRRPRGEESAALPGWMTTIDTFGPGRASGLAVVLSAANPKNLLLVSLPSEPGNPAGVSCPPSPSATAVVQGTPRGHRRVAGR